jgi:ABC-type polysaccharide/polyol phosphate export permease
MLRLFRALRQQGDLLYMLTKRDITVKYKQSVMGLLWAILMPVLITSAGVLVKVGLAHLSHKPVRLEEILGVTVKALPWSFFVASIRFSTPCLANNANLVTKIAFPRVVFPLSVVASQLFDFGIASGVLTIVFILGRAGVSWHLAWVPVLLAMMIALTTSLALLLSAANLFFRDVKYLVEVVLTFAIFFTPVFYDVNMFGKWGDLLLLNPVAPILIGLSNSIVDHTCPSLTWIGYSAAVTAVLATAAPTIFYRLEPKFAESV